MILLKSLKFWTLLVTLVLFIVQSYVPSFPFDQDALLKFALFVLGLLHIEPEIRASLK